MIGGDLTAVERELKTQNALLRLVHRQAIEQERAQVLADPAFAAALANAQTPIDAGSLKTAVAKETGQSSATVKRRIAELVERGLLERSGAGGHITYVTTGLVLP